MLLYHGHLTTHYTVSRHVGQLAVGSDPKHGSRSLRGCSRSLDPPAQTRDLCAQDALPVVWDAVIRFGERIERMERAAQSVQSVLDNPLTAIPCPTRPVRRASGHRVDSSELPIQVAPEIDKEQTHFDRAAKASKRDPCFHNILPACCYAWHLVPLTAQSRPE